MPSIDVADFDGDRVAFQVNANGRQPASGSRPVALANEDLAAIQGIATALGAATYYPAEQPVSGAVSVTGNVAVTGPLTDTQLRAAPVPVSGTVAITAAALPLPAGAATAANQSALIGHVDGIEAALATLGTQTTLAAILAKIIAAPATEAKQDATTAAIQALVGTEYETVATGQTNQALGAAGAAGDLLTSLLIVPASTSPGAVTIKDGAGAAITVFAGGADSVSTLHPFAVPVNIRSVAGAWQVTTGADVSAIAAGNFT